MLGPTWIVWDIHVIKHLVESPIFTVLSIVVASFELSLFLIFSFSLSVNVCFALIFTFYFFLFLGIRFYNDKRRKKIVADCDPLFNLEFVL